MRKLFEPAILNAGGLINAREAGDTDTYHALKIAKELLSQGVTFERAGVDRFAGLVLIGRSGGWRFKSPLCSYQGTGPNTSAEILEMFGFGEKANILAVICDSTKSRYFFP